MILSRKKHEFAELVEIFTLLGSVTFNESDDRAKFTEWKLWCGYISNLLTDRVKEWNNEALERCKMPDDLKKRLNSFYNAVEKNKDNLKVVDSLEEKYKSDLEEEQRYVKMLDDVFSEDAEFEVDKPWPKSDLPLNINGAYLDMIKEVLV